MLTIAWLAVNNHWTGLVDWTVDWTGRPDWWTGLVDWTVDWTGRLAGLVDWTDYSLMGHTTFSPCAHVFHAGCVSHS